MSEVVTLAHGEGGRLYQQLVEQIFVPAFDNEYLRQLGDSAVCPWPSTLAVGESGGRLALTTDSFVVRPRFFPGGDIGHLAVCGTVNDLAVSGARPLYLTCGMVIEAGLSYDELRRVCQSMAATARQAGVSIVSGDTKVVEKGGCDGLFINTAGVGCFEREPLPQRVQPGDLILVSGSLGDHGLAILAARQQLGFEPPLRSDAAPLNGLVEVLLQAAPATHALRDATRGGLAAVSNEWAASSRVTIELEAAAMPLDKRTAAACELLGLDPLLAANEGKLVAAVPPQQAAAALSALRGHELGRNAAIVGRVAAAVADKAKALVSLDTPYGTRRILALPEGEQLPRIC